MLNTYLQIPKSSIIELLKVFPQNKIIEIFNDLIVYYDDSPLTKSEKQSINKGLVEKKNGELLNWEDIR